MAVAFQNFGGTAVNATTANLLFTCTSGAVMVVFLASNATVSISAVAYNGVALTRLGNASGNAGPLEAWGLTAPDAGTFTLSAQFTVTANFAMAAMAYTGASTANPFGTVASATATSASNVNFSISSTTVDLVAVGAFVPNIFSPSFNNATNRGSVAAGTALLMAVGDAAGAAPKTVSATVSFSQNWRLLGVPIVHFSAGTATAATPMMALLGAGA